MPDEFSAGGSLSAKLIPTCPARDTCQWQLLHNSHARQVAPIAPSQLAAALPPPTFALTTDILQCSVLQDTAILSGRIGDK